MLIPLSKLHAHPDNANVMPPRLLRKLIAHLKASGRYPPLIVRPHPDQADDYQILDGHHRAQGLRAIKATTAQCEVWPDVHDEQAAILLLTLNRLRGEDDPMKRAALLARLRQVKPEKDLLAEIPENRAKLRALLRLREPPPAPAPPPRADDMPEPVIFFLRPLQCARLFDRLQPIARERSEALITLLDLDGDQP